MECSVCLLVPHEDQVFALGKHKVEELLVAVVGRFVDDFISPHASPVDSSDLTCVFHYGDSPTLFEQDLDEVIVPVGSGVEEGLCGEFLVLAGKQAQAATQDLAETNTA